MPPSSPPSMFTPEEIAQLRTLHLREDAVQKALAGFLHAGLKESASVDVPTEVLKDMLRLYARAIDEMLDKAIKLMNDAGDPRTRRAAH